MSEKINNKQLQYLKSLGTISKSEIIDLLEGWTNPDIILDVDELEIFNKLKDIDLQIGRTIELISMDNDPNPIECGTKGKIIKINDMPFNEKQIEVEWENGRTLSLIYPVDKFKIIH
jgi:hypothetical protein